MRTRGVIKKTKVVYRCKHCKIRVLGPNDFRPYMGLTHTKKCPRRRFG